MSVMDKNIRPFHRELHSARRYLQSAQRSDMDPKAAADLAFQCLEEAERQREKFGPMVAKLLEQTYTPLGEARQTGSTAALDQAEDAIAHVIANVHTAEPCPPEEE